GSGSEVESDLAGGGTAFEQAQCIVCVVESEQGGFGNLERAVAQQWLECGPLAAEMVRGRSDVFTPACADDRNVLQKKAIDLHCRNASAREPQDHGTAVGGQGAQAVGEAVTTHRVENDVHTATAGEFESALLEVVDGDRVGSAIGLRDGGLL